MYLLLLMLFTSSCSYNFLFIFSFYLAKGIFSSVSNVATLMMTKSAQSLTFNCYCGFFLPCWSFPLSLFCTLRSLCQTSTHTHSGNLLVVWLENAPRPLLSPLKNAYLPCLLVQCHLQRSAEPGTENSSQPYRGMTFKCKFNLNNRGDRHTARETVEERASPDM